MIDPAIFRMLEGLPPGVGAAVAVLLLAGIGVLNLTLAVVKFALQRRDSAAANATRERIAEATACHYPPELVEPARTAFARQMLIADGQAQRQQAIAEQQMAAIGALREAIGDLIECNERSSAATALQTQRVTDALTSNTIELVRALARLDLRVRDNPGQHS